MELRAGYKKTEVGAIPDDWNLVKLENLCTKIGDGIHTTPQYSIGGEYFFVNGNNLNGGKIIISDDTKKVSKEEYLIHKRELNGSTVLLSINGTIGNIAFYNGENIVLGKSAAYLNFNDKIDKRLVYQLVQTEFVKQYFTNELTGSTIKNLGLGSIRDTPIPLPPYKEEQTAIANALSDADAFIDSLKKLIAKKRNIKQGAMQNLLQPKAGWEVKKLGEVAEVVGGGTPSSFISSYWNGNINWFTPTEIGGSKYAFESIRKITKEGFANCSGKMLPIGTILLTSRAGIGDLSILMREGCTNQGFQSLIAKADSYNEYLYYLMQTLKGVLIQNASGSTFLEISPNKLKQIEISIPKKDEQIRIATILSDIDAEINALETKLEKYRNLKTGMMQSLLTGKIRLI